MSTHLDNPSLTMPPEWASHDATWIAWPHNRTDWPGKMAVIPWVYAEMVRPIAREERVHILVTDVRQKQRARAVLEKSHVNMDRIHFHAWPTDRGWTRDYGPICALRSGQLVVLNFQFNAWARYPHWQKDNAVAERAAEVLGVDVISPQHSGQPIVLEGGALDVNGQGTLITTEECLLDSKRQVRNPGFARADYEDLFERYLGATHTIWLGRGIAGDDTHGHVDDCCRFVNPSTVVVAQADDNDAENRSILAENLERLQGARLADGTKPSVVQLPMPAPLYFDGRRLPASYANFYMANAGVLVPTFNDPKDRIALGILSELIPDRPVRGIHAVDLVLGLGTLHCLTQQQPAPWPLAE